jgi:hypothetical protein
MKRLSAAIARFLFSEASDTWPLLLRIGLGAEVLLYCLLSREEWSAFLSSGTAGLVDRRLPEIILAGQSRLIPQMSWLVSAANYAGLNEQMTLQVVWAVLLAAGLALMAGFFSRVAAVVAWFLHLAAAKSGSLFAYGADNFITIGLFYLMLAPQSSGWSLDARFRRERGFNCSRSGFFLRLLQLHLCVIYFFSGLTKAFGRGWWDGSNLWQSLARPGFDRIPTEMIASLSFLLPLGGIAVWVIEMSYPIFIWGNKTRPVWLLLICAMHIGIGLAMGMYLFAGIMLVLNVAAFGSGLLPRLTPAGAR